MPKPVGEGQRYLPGLDGLRAVAVAVVVAYHLRLGWAGGGLLGVGIFFTLSGYLITDILVGQWRSRGRINLRDFWMRRARRLLPALFVVLAVVAAWASIVYPGQLTSLRGDIVAAALYVSNWWFIAQNASYFSRFGAPSPLGHLWSLAVEEQFYLVWPWIVLAGGTLLTRKMRLTTRQAGVAAVAVTLVLAAASFVALALAFHPGVDPTRAYEGTDTRAGGLLVGAALALVWPTRRARPARKPAAKHSVAAKHSGRATATTRQKESAGLATALLDAAGVIGLVVIALMIWRSGEYSPFLYQGGLLLLSVATAMVIAAVVHPATRLGRVLGVGPLRWLGVRSYGIYLWHYPVIVLTAPGANPDGAAMSGERQVLTAGACVAVAALSWALVEDPIRSQRVPRALRPAGAVVASAVQWARGGWLRAAAACTMAVGVGGVAAVGGFVLTGALSSGSQARGTLAGDAQPGSGLGAGRGLAAVGGTGKSGGVAAARDGLYGPGSLGTGLVVSAPLTGVVTQAQATADASVAGPGGAYVAGLPEPPPRTSCKSVVHIGDSTSDGLISSAYLPDAAQRIPARYAQIGVTSVHMEVVGGTSIVEEYDSQPNAYDVAQRYRSQGYQGCWVIALGTNDTADVAVGSNVGLAARIKRMMSVIGNQPVMWITVKSLLSSGPYSEQNMQQWDQALYAAAKDYPNMKIYDWASVVQTPWFINDGIHFTSVGYAARGELIADALAAAFPGPTAPTVR
jgi:peptidoglycan/LPS O-acetylase OafA/YrhL